MTDNHSTALALLVTNEKDARAFGFEWPHEAMIVEQAVSECHEILEAIEQEEPRERVQEEIGDLIHTAISLCLFAGFDVNETLALVNNKFSQRMRAVKQITQERGLKTLHGQSIEYLMQVWREAKKFEQTS